MNQRLHFITLGVADVAASRRFYSEGLGWAPTADLPEIIFYQVAPGVILGLWSLDELGKDAGAAATAGTSFALAQNVESDDEVGAIVDRVVAAGGTVLQAPHRASFGGWNAYVADPDGHRWEICHNTGWSVGDDGTVHLGPVT